MCVKFVKPILCNCRSHLPSYVIPGIMSHRVRPENLEFSLSYDLFELVILPLPQH